VTTYAVTFGGRRRLIWTTAEELEELRPVADTEQHHMRSCMDDQRFLNSYHNASTPPGPDIPADLAGFMLAADPILGEAAELSRVLGHAHQGAATQLFGEDWAHARKYFSLSEKYAAWAYYNTPAQGFGIHAYAHKVHRPIRLTDEALRAHPEWRNFGSAEGRHPPMRGWLAVPLIGSDGRTTDSFRSPTVWRATSPHRTKRTSCVWRHSLRQPWTRSRNSTFLSTGSRPRIRGNDPPPDRIDDEQ
jgi:hypothetical protein